MKTIDITPTWEAVTPILLMTLQRTKNDTEATDIAQRELMRMANLADKWVKHLKERESE